MVHVLVGDMFESKAQTLVNTVNCVGVMGKGVALEFKKRFPTMYEDYVQRCHAKQVRLGEPYLFRQMFEPWVVNFPTKDHWRSVSRLTDIEEGLEYLGRCYRDWGIESLAVPALGCSNGGLEWRVVGPTLYRHLATLDIPVELYAPLGTPVEQLQQVFLTRHTAIAPRSGVVTQLPKVNPAWIALVEIVSRIEREPYHWMVGRTIFQKIAYFATESGLPTGLQHQKHSYGPFAPELKPIITRLVNNGLLREEQIGNMLAIKLGPTYQDAREEYHADLTQWESIIERVTDLFLRMQTRQAEIAATIHFTARSLQRDTGNMPSEYEVFDEVMRWKARRPPLDEEEVAQAIRDLGTLRWLDVRPSEGLHVPDDVLLGV